MEAVEAVVEVAEAVGQGLRVGDFEIAFVVGHEVLLRQLASFAAF